MTSRSKLFNPPFSKYPHFGYKKDIITVGLDRSEHGVHLRAIYFGAKTFRVPAPKISQDLLAPRIIFNVKSDSCLLLCFAAMTKTP